MMEEHEMNEENKVNVMEELTDRYFTRTRKTAINFADKEVVYAVFVRHEALVALKYVENLVEKYFPQGDVQIIRTMVDKSGNVIVNNEGNYVPAGKPICFIKGKHSALSEFETLMLQKIGFVCIGAYNAYRMAKTLPHVPFMDMSARHLMDPIVHEMACYAAKVGSDKAAKEVNAKGFVGTSTNAAAKAIFGQSEGIGTIPHAAIGLAQVTIQEGNFTNLSHNATLRSLQMFHEANPEVKKLVALVDYNGAEVTDSIFCSEWFWNETNLSEHDFSLAVRLDTHGGRYAERLSWKKSIEVLERHLDIGGEYEIIRHVLGPAAYDLDERNELKDNVRKILFGTGVSAANIIHVRQSLDGVGFNKTGIIATSGFNLAKCTVMAACKVAIDAIGTGSYLPKTMSETFATADIVKYDGIYAVKLGRDHLIDDLKRAETAW